MIGSMTGSISFHTQTTLLYPLVIHRLPLSTEQKLWGNSWNFGGFHEVSFVLISSHSMPNSLHLGTHRYMPLLCGATFNCMGPKEVLWWRTSPPAPSVLWRHLEDYYGTSLRWVQGITITLFLEYTVGLNGSCCIIRHDNTLTIFLHCFRS